MHSTFSRRPARRLLCTAIACAAFASASAQAQFPFPRGLFSGSPMAMLPGMGWTQELQRAHAHKAAGRNEEAVAAYDHVLGVLERVPGGDSMALMALPSYGAVLLRLQRYDDAERILTRALQFETVAQRGGAMTAMDAMTQLGNAFRIAREASRQLNQELIVEGPDGDPRTAELALRPPEATTPLVLLAEVYAQRGAAGDRERLATLFDDVVLPRLAKPTADPNNALTAMAAEAAGWRVAAALAHAGLDARANQAFEQALASNRQRLQTFGTGAAPLPTQIAGFQHRRMIGSAYATHVLGTGVTAPGGVRPVLSGEQAQGLFAAIASTKGLASRYAGKRNALLATLSTPTVVQAHEETRALEQQLRALPLTGEAALAAHVQWMNDHAAALKPAMPELAAAGLDEVFVDGTQTLQAVRRQLGDAALIGYALYQPVDFKDLAPQASRYLRYTVTRQGLTVRDIGDKRSIDQLLHAWRTEIDQPTLPRSGAELAATLLGGLDGAVASASEWVIDPDAALALLPFEALPAAGGVVLDAHRVRYVSSLAALAEQADTLPRNASGQGFVLADPLYATNATPSTASTTLPTADLRVAGLQLQPLPDTRAEASAVAQAMRSLGVAPTVLLGANATPSALRQQQAPRFVHVAAHGLFLVPDVDMADPALHRIAVVVPGLMTGLALTPGADGPMLWASELAQTNLRGTELVVLSACDTGNGLVDVGEGLTSLRRATEAAGARATVTSLWPVSSPQTTALMRDFYGAMATGLGKDAALQRAKLAARARGASVRDWAGFLIAGDVR